MQVLAVELRLGLPVAYSPSLKVGASPNPLFVFLFGGNFLETSNRETGSNNERK
jgi:hypothetical protein